MYFLQMIHSAVAEWQRKVLLVCLTWMVFVGAVQAQDTLYVSLSEAERIFLERNFQLLAQRFNIQASEAALQQARYYANPSLIFQLNALNPQTGKLFPLAPLTQEQLNNNQYPGGQIDLQFSQLIYTASKRSKLVKLAESNRQLQQLAFEDLLRILRYQLLTTFANLCYDLQAYRLLNQEAVRQGSLVRAVQLLFAQGGASAYEVTRLEAEWQSLLTDKQNLLTQITQEEAQLKVFLGFRERSFILPLEPELAPKAIPGFNVVLDSALSRRPDIRLSEEQLENARRNTQLQRAQRIPDVTATLEYDRYGNAYRNYFGVALAVPLPVFNRNQGNIRLAKIGEESSRKAIEAQQNQAEQEVTAAYQQLQGAEQLFALTTQTYRNSLQNISLEATRNFNNRTINLLDYLDKVRTYKQAQLNLLHLENNLFQSRQQLNFVTNSHFF